MNSQSQKKYNYKGISSTYEGGGIYNGGTVNTVLSRDMSKNLQYGLKRLAVYKF